MDGDKWQVIISGEQVGSVILPAAEHEAGHIIAAHHFNARVLGIGVGFRPGLSREDELLVQAFHDVHELSVETHCVVKAAGPASDILFHGGLNEQAASVDLREIEMLTGEATLEPYLEQAKNILARYPNEFRCIASSLRRSLETHGYREPYEWGSSVGILLLDETQLLNCLSENPSQAP